jgi:hypothetical protein
MSLQDFLNSNPVDGLTEEVVVSKRFKDKDGNVLKFKIKAMSPGEHADLQKKCTTIRKGGKMDFDQRKFTTVSVIENTLDPDFKDAASIKAMECNTPEEYLNKVLLVGEMYNLSGAINELSGFDQSMEELVEEAKN